MKRSSIEIFGKPFYSNMDLTFGIELEFIAIYPDGHFEHYGGPHTAARCGQSNQCEYILCEAFRSKRIPVTREAVQGNNGKFSNWIIGTDSHNLTAEEELHVPQGYRVEPLELASRKFHFYTDDWQTEIKAVLEILSGFETSGVKFVTNEQTGFHVHVGNHDRLWPLRTVKSLLQLVTAFEWCFDTLHMVHRIVHPIYDLCQYMTPSWFFLQKPKLGAQNRLDSPRDWLATIESVKTIAEFCKLFQFDEGDFEGETNGHFSAYNFDNLIPTDRRAIPTGTIEFRQHAGTLEFKDIVAWITLTSKLVEWCHLCQDPTPTMSLSRYICTREFKLHHLFEAMGLDGLTWEYYDLQTDSPCDMAQCRGERAMQQVSGTVLEGLVAAVEQTRYNNSQSGVVQRTIDEKFANGQYGRWPAAVEYLFEYRAEFEGRLALSGLQREINRIAVVDDDDEDDDSDGMDFDE